jgi:hypothetical protein
MAALTALLLGKNGLAAGILAGALVSWLNLLWLAAIVRGLLVGPRRPRGFGVSLALKELALLLVVGALVGFRVVDPIGFLAGLSGLFLSVTIVALGRRRAGSLLNENDSAPEAGSEENSKE